MRHDPWITEISPDDIEAAMQRKAAREALIVKQAAEITRLLARVAELRGALQKIQNLARTGRPHPMSRKTDYFQIAATALTGGKDE